MTTHIFEDAAPSPLAPRRTLRDVARLAGVSVSTASMALADKSRVSASTKQAVRQAAAALSYVPNSSGRALRAQRVGALAVVVPHTSHHVFTHPVFMDLLEGITAAANEHGVTTILSTAPAEHDEAPAYLRILEGRQADGVIVASASVRDQNVDRLAASGYPVTLVGRRPHRPSLHCVGIDDLGGFQALTEHLLGAHGHRRLAHIAGPLDHQSAIDKHEGFRAALAQAGVAYDPSLVVESDYSQEGGHAAALELLEGPALDAIVAANDQMAFGAIEAMRDHGLDAPRDLAVVGYDDIGLARVMHPQLTSVCADLVEVGRLAAERLLELMAGKQPQPVQRELPTTVIVRASCGCPPERIQRGTTA
ncbi:MAG: LacI family transcriptional regulator [Gaiellaceae bacterium MAG52_C11]|nr:LacI family transcriptional regulator [Candidatus Gaiellasilicea maunaloa]